LDGGLKIKPLQRNKQQEGSYLAFYSIGINLPSFTLITFGRSLSKKLPHKFGVPLVRLPFIPVPLFDRHVPSAARPLRQAQGKREQGTQSEGEKKGMNREFGLDALSAHERSSWQKH
jgi:hypothetical protein